MARFTSDGTLDNGFGIGGGRATGLFGVSIGTASAVTVLPTGEAVIAGHVGHDFAAVKLDAIGRLDPSFGPPATDASASRWPPTTGRSHRDRAPGRRQVAAGRLGLHRRGHSGDFAVLRLSAEGTLDTSFGNGGSMQRPVAEGSKTDLGRALVLQADERIPTVRALVAGEAQDVNRDFALMRLWL